MSVAKFFSACLALVLSTVVYASIMYQTDKSDRKIIFDKITSALKDGDLLPNLFPPVHRSLDSGQPDRHRPVDRELLCLDGDVSGQ